MNNLAKIALAAVACLTVASVSFAQATKKPMMATHHKMASHHKNVTHHKMTGHHMMTSHHKMSTHHKNVTHHKMTGHHKMTSHHTAMKKKPMAGGMGKMGK